MLVMQPLISLYLFKRLTTLCSLLGAKRADYETLDLYIPP